MRDAAITLKVDRRGNQQHVAPQATKATVGTFHRSTDRARVVNKISIGRGRAVEGGSAGSCPARRDVAPLCVSQTSVLAATAASSDDGTGDGQEEENATGHPIMSTKTPTKSKECIFTLRKRSAVGLFRSSGLIRVILWHCITALRWAGHPLLLLHLALEASSLPRTNKQGSQYFAYCVAAAHN